MINAWQDGQRMSLDVTVAHGWQQSERTHVGRERWRSFLRRKEELKHAKYDGPCQRKGWGFGALAFGTWGGLGPEGARLLARVVKRACAATEPGYREDKAGELYQSIGLALFRQVWRLLGGRNSVR